MCETAEPQSEIGELLKDSPKNWGKWGADDEVGALNYLTPDVILSAMRSVKSGKTFTLQLKMADPAGDPVWPGAGRSGAVRVNIIDEGHWIGEKGPAYPGGWHVADDYMTVYPQGSTQYDALGHVWHDGKIWNGFDAKSTIGGMSKASVFPIAERGIAGRGILLDIARWRGKSRLDRRETFDHEDLMACAKAQGCTIEKRDILLVRTGWIGSFYALGREEFYRDYSEPGLTYSPELVEWFRDMEIPNLVTDTMANEVTIDPKTGIMIPLHHALMRNLGVAFTEIAWLDDLAEDCDADRQFEFFYTAAPLKIVDGCGAPVNPLVIK